MISVLYVDDEPYLLEIAQLFLEQTGRFRVGTSTSAQDALNSPDIISYDAIVSDYQMPGMDGIGFLKEVRQRYGDVPFILFTGRGREEVVIDAINNGADFYIQKGGEPSSQFAELADKIQYAVSKKRAEQELRRKNEELNASYEQITAADEELRGQYEELAQSERRIRESERKFRSIFEQIHSALVLFTRDGCIDCNRQALELYGYPSREEFLGLLPPDVSPPFQPDGQDSRVAAAAHIRTVFEKGVDHFEWLQQRKDGSTFLADILLSAFELDGEQVLLSSVRDITSRRMMEDELQLLKISVERSSDEVFWINFDGTILYVNDAACRTTGYSRDELLAMKLFELDPDFPPEVWGASVADLRQRKTQFITTRHRRKDGVIIDVEIVAVYVSMDSREYSFAFVRDITGRRKAEEALRESEGKFRRLIEGAPEAIYIGTDWKFVYLNTAAVRLFGASSPEQLIGTPFMDRIHPRFHDTIRRRVHQLYDEQAPVPVLEEVYLRLDRTEFDVEVSSVPFIYEGENGAVVFVRDISDRKRAERELRESEMQYRRIFDSFVDIYYETDTDGIIRVISPSVFPLAGWRPEELLGRSILTLYQNPPDRQRLLLQLEQTPVVSGFEVMLKRRDGSPTPVSVNARVRYGTNGEPDGLMGSIRDITEMARARKALQASEEKYRSILENMQDAYYRTDRDGKITMVNPAGARMSGYSSPDEMIGTPIASLYFNPETREDVLKKLDKGGSVTDVTARWRCRDGTTFWVSLSVQFIRGDDGSIIGSEGIIRDITDRKSMEQVIQEANRKLNLLNSITRHDVVNQLTILNGYAQLASMKITEPVVADFLGKIEATADTISRQIEFTKTYQELGVHTPAWIRLDEIIAAAGRGEVTFSSTCRSLSIFADPMFERVFFNLFENAIQHGERVTSIAVRCERAVDGLVIIVEDDGVGIAPEEKEKIFEKGFGKNTGFGLFLAREILAITGITIRETGYLGVGARFEITVPKDRYRITQNNDPSG